ncbi:MAG: hypothetical protein CMO80_23730 [Verrucomicrobiales bacterium]|nr:hypothetical protein [Verrucomicrobiales bacterium]|tara:strand:+ start:41 stop:442 length:402 start_codon:yes stop_codon:yes gene_type:complete
MLRRNKILIGLGVIGLVIAMLGFPIWMTILSAFKERSQRIAFDRKKWVEESTFKDPQRIRMVDDLLKTRSFENMSSNDVVELLGPPEAMAFFRNYDIAYWLGPERGFTSIDSEWLVFRLDDSGKVTEQRIVRD